MACHSLKGTQADPLYREINVISYPPLVQPTENSCPDLDLNPGHRRSSASKAHQILWLRKRISPLSHVGGKWSGILYRMKEMKDDERLNKTCCDFVIRKPLCCIADSQAPEASVDVKEKVVRFSHCIRCKYMIRSVCTHG